MLPGFSTTSLSPAANLRALQALRPSPRMPVLFLGHGSPMNVIGDNAWRRSWQAMGAELTARAAQPQLILCVSAHWLTRGGWYPTGMAEPRTIHDFGGFRQELFDRQYPVPGAPAVARSLAKDLKNRPRLEWRWAWMRASGGWTTARGRAQADVPEGTDTGDAAEHGLQSWPCRTPCPGPATRCTARPWRTHRGQRQHRAQLRATRRGTAANEAYDWAAEFDTLVQDRIKKGQLGALRDFLALGPVARQAHPTHEHYLPLLYAAGAAQANEMPRFFNTGVQSAAISMRSVLWG